MNYNESVRYLLTLGRELASPQQARAAKFDLHNIARHLRTYGPSGTSLCVRAHRRNEWQRLDCGNAGKHPSGFWAALRPLHVPAPIAHQ